MCWSWIILNRQGSCDSAVASNLFPGTSSTQKWNDVSHLCIKVSHNFTLNKQRRKLVLWLAQLMNILIALNMPIRPRPWTYVHRYNYYQSVRFPNVRNVFGSAPNVYFSFKFAFNAGCTYFCRFGVWLTSIGTLVFTSAFCKNGFSGVSCYVM